MSLTPKEQKDIKDSFLQTIYEFRQILKTNYILDLITLEFDGNKIILKIKVEDKLIEHAKEVIPLKGIYPILVGKFNFSYLMLNPLRSYFLIFYVIVAFSTKS